MQFEKPFKVRNAKIDAQGNIVIVRLHEAAGCLDASALLSTGTSSPSFPRSCHNTEDKEKFGTIKKRGWATRHDIVGVVRETLRSPFRTKEIRSVRFRFLHSARARLHAYEAHASPRARILLRSSRFLGNFTAMFLFLFLALNAPSFWEIMQARLFPGATGRARQALEVVAAPIARRSLLPPPELPVAGRNTDGILVAAPTVAPPDNRLIIPKMGKNVRIVEATDAALRREDWKTFEKDIQDALRFGVVRYPGTAKPGEPGNIFMTGHSAYLPWDSGRYKEVFARLGDLEPGDEYSIYYEGKLHRYRIVKKFEVQPKDVSVLEQPNDRRMSTLMTCTPIGTTLRRLIVQAEEVDPLTGGALEIAETDMPVGKEVQKFGDALPGWGNGLPI